MHNMYSRVYIYRSRMHAVFLKHFAHALYIYSQNSDDKRLVKLLHKAHIFIACQMNEPKIEEKKRRGRKTEQQKTMKSNIHQMKHMDEKVIRQSHLFETAIVFAKLQCIRSLANKRIYTNKIFVVFSFFFLRMPKMQYGYLLLL